MEKLPQIETKAGDNQKNGLERRPSSSLSSPLDSANAVLIPDDESDLRDLDERVLRSDGPPLQTEEPALR